MPNKKELIELFSDEINNPQKILINHGRTKKEKAKTRKALQEVIQEDDEYNTQFFQEAINEAIVVSKAKRGRPKKCNLIKQLYPDSNILTI